MAADIQGHIPMGSGGGLNLYVETVTLVDGSGTVTPPGWKKVLGRWATSNSSASGLLTTSISGTTITVTTNTGETGTVQVFALGY